MGGEIAKLWEENLQLKTQIALLHQACQIMVDSLEIALAEGRTALEEYRKKVENKGYMPKF